MGKRVTGCTFQRPLEEGRQAEAVVEKDPEAPGEGQRGGGAGLVLSAMIHQPTLLRTPESQVQSQTRETDT